jgi:NAD(P)-dependent dehydrogenase (short-subunit alcohol dehydrogenase family)
MDVTSEQQVEDGTAKVIQVFGALDVLISNAGIQIVAPVVDVEFAKWKRLLAIHLDGAFLTTRAALRQMYKQNSGSIIYMGSVHSKETSVLKAPYVTAKHGLIGLAKVVAKDGAAHGVCANVVCPGFVRTPLVDKQIPEQAKELGISEQEVIKNVMLKETVDGEFTTVGGRGRDGGLPRFLRLERANWPVDRSESRLVHAVGQYAGDSRRCNSSRSAASRAIRLRGGAQASRGSMSVPDRFLNSQYRRGRRRRLS